ncbi:MAG: FkbM family methyltransferase [Acidobacteria bacterium]|nr:MAG: FkbM family methyltransferase [Acidobacteriota bacterium]PYR49509.1 MAG: FkbM family methyltransferase [Acidobacteriota bacterium]
MSGIARAMGLARSLAIYHMIPGRQGRLRHLYANFVHRGDLVFDVGGHAGNHARAFAALGCRVVVLEPQPDFARVLRAFFHRAPQVEVIEVAAAATPGRALLLLSERTPTVSTLVAAWRNARARDPDFAGVQWNRQVEVEVTTLDRVIERFGAPMFVKIDVEGSEAAVLEGLSLTVPALSFEYLPSGLDEVRTCVTRLTALGPYHFNWSAGQSYQFASEHWLNGPELLATLQAHVAARRQSGDVYARLSPIR